MSGTGTTSPLSSSSSVSTSTSPPSILGNANSPPLSGISGRKHFHKLVPTQSLQPGWDNSARGQPNKRVYKKLSMPFSTSLSTSFSSSSSLSFEANVKKGDDKKNRNILTKSSAILIDQSEKEVRDKKNTNQAHKIVKSASYPTGCTRQFLSSTLIKRRSASAPSASAKDKTNQVSKAHQEDGKMAQAWLHADEQTVKRRSSVGIEQLAYLDITILFFDSIPKHFAKECILRMVVDKMPKIDVHTHLSGAQHPSNLIGAAARNGFYLDPIRKKLYKPETSHTKISMENASKKELVAHIIPKEHIPVDDLLTKLEYSGLASVCRNNLSMMGSASSNDNHDHFFNNVFITSEPVRDQMPLVEQMRNVLTEVTIHNIFYKEQMLELPFSGDNDLLIGFFNNTDFFKIQTMLNEERYRQLLETESSVFDESARVAKEGLSNLKKRFKDAFSVLQDSGAIDLYIAAGVKEMRSLQTIDSERRVSYLLEVMRTDYQHHFFLRAALAFALGQAHPDLVLGVNVGGQEDHELSKLQINVQYQMIKFLRNIYPLPKLSMHAGELNRITATSLQMYAPITDAITIAGADRIGHGYTLHQEKNPSYLHKLIKERHVAFESCPESALQLGGRSIIPLLQALEIPFSICTDDAGVFNTDLTEQYMKTMEAFRLNYRAIKKIVFDSLHHSFLSKNDKTKKLSQLTAKFIEFEKEVAERCLAGLSEQDAKSFLSQRKLN